MTRTALAASVACALAAVAYVAGWVWTGAGADLAYAATFTYLALIDPVRRLRSVVVTPRCGSRTATTGTTL